MSIPIIDLFAGPGGLGEGFSSLIDENGERIFEIKLSIEKDSFAHQTLLLRSFLRQFPVNEFPEEYYNMLRENNSKMRDSLKQEMFAKHQIKKDVAEKEAWLCELGSEKFPNGLIDLRIKKALKNSDNWVLIGGPPCQAYSLVGRSRNRGISDEDTRVFLYREYLRIIAKHHPSIFVMENVKGLLSAKLGDNRIFEWIKKDLRNPGTLFPQYKSPKYMLYSFVKPPDDFDGNEPVYKKDEDFLIKTEKYGIPQNRHRVILLGIREDLGIINYEPLIKRTQVNLEDVIGKLPKLRSGIGREIKSIDSKGKNVYGKFSDSELNWDNTLNEYFYKIRKEFDTNFDLNLLSGLTTGRHFCEFNSEDSVNPLHEWFYDSKLKGIIHHESRTHLKEDLSRYLFSAIYLKLNKDFPKLKDYPEWLLPNHENARGTKFADRFRTQRPDQPATTLTSHISKDGHYFIHYDPSQCRSLTVREAARIQTFPDNYFFCGARTQQYHQVGNAVPPFLAKQLAVIIKKILNR